MRKTPCSINNAAKIRHQIQGHSHWFDQLRIAENIINEKEDAIAKAKIDMVLSLKKLKYRLNTQERLDTIARLELEADMARLEIEKRQFDRLIRDAEFELNIAQECKQQILTNHPEIEDLDYEVIQGEITEDAYAQNLASSVALHTMEQHLGIPSGLIDAIAGQPELIAKIKPLAAKQLEVFKSGVKELRGADLSED